VPVCPGAHPGLLLWGPWRGGTLVTFDLLQFGGERAWEPVPISPPPAPPPCIVSWNLPVADTHLEIQKASAQSLTFPKQPGSPGSPE
jgi:hypothetical protein